ncbi:MAG TPA: FMN-binding protein [Candidatus Kaiserbacteria bacterium]|nr:FMN-binding protein [Candidatus Kaiserbacteria bacterium]
MKKIISSLIFIFAFALYVAFRPHAAASPIIVSDMSSAPTITPVIIYNTPTKKATTPVVRKTLNVTTVKKQTSVKKASTPSMMHHKQIPVMHRGPYVDGIYTGQIADAYYETFQIRVVIKNGSLVKAYPLPYRQYNSTSQYINNYAMPVLSSEALTIQNAQVNTISGATETSRAFRTSLADALHKAT